MRKIFIAGNWKMNKGDAASATELARGIADAVKGNDNVDVAVCPPFTALGAVADAIKGSPVALGAQNLYPKTEGAFTGETSPQFIKDLGCTYVILGHSERRHIFNESDEFINEKVHAAFAAGLKPILCCGETLEERNADRTEQVVERQLTGGLKGVSAEQLADLVIAYEPVWAIGTGVVATTEQAQGVHQFIRELLGRLYNSDVADNMQLQYGGSVKPDNAAGLLSQPDIDGALVGGAALKVDNFVGIIQAAP